MPKNAHKSKNSNKYRKSGKLTVDPAFYQCEAGEVFADVTANHGNNISCILLISETGKQMQDGREVIASIGINSKIWNKPNKRISVGSIVKLEQTKKNPKKKDWLVVDVHPHKKREKTLKILGLKKPSEENENSDFIVFIRDENNKGYKNDEAFVDEI